MGDIEGVRFSNVWVRGLIFVLIGFGVVWIGVVIVLYIWVWFVVMLLNGYDNVNLCDFKFY